MPQNLFWEKGNLSPINFEASQTESVNQVAHGFTLPVYGVIPVYDNSGTWTAADGSASSTYHDAVIIEVTDADNFVIQRNGYVRVDNHGLQLYTDYYLSEDLAGDIVYNEPASAVKVVTPVDEDWLYIHNYNTPRVVNGLNIDSTTGQIKLGGPLTESTQVGGASSGFNLSLYGLLTGLYGDLVATMQGASVSMISTSSTLIQSTGFIAIGTGSGQTIYIIPSGGTTTAGDVLYLHNASTGEVRYKTIGEFLTDVFRIADATDTTKKIAFNASAITTGTTRTITMPDSDIDLGNIGSDEKDDALFRIYDDGDNTKKIAFQASGISTSTTRTITMPDSDVDLGDLARIGDQACATFYDNTGGQVLTTTRTVVNLDTTMTNNATGVFSLATDEVTVSEDGYYLISFQVGAGLNSGTRENYYGYLQLDTGAGFSDIDGTFIGGYSRIAGETSSASGSIIYQLSAGDKLRISAESTLANGNITVADASRLSILQLKGIKGDTGAAGPAGGNEKVDNVFRIVDDGDNTKKIAFQASGITTGTTRTITMPDADVTLGSSFDPGTYANATSYHPDMSGTLQSRQDDAGRIYLKGRVDVDVATGFDSADFCTLNDAPSATRYIKVIYYDSSSFDYSYTLEVDSSGNINAIGGSYFLLAGAYFLFDSVQFES